MTDINAIKVEITLGDLIKLKELAGYYELTVKERDKYLTELVELRKEVEILRNK